MSERRNHFWIDRARERTSFWWQPLPDQDKQDLNSRKRTYTHSSHKHQPIQYFSIISPPANSFWAAKLRAQTASPVRVGADKQLRVVFEGR